MKEFLKSVVEYYLPLVKTPEGKQNPFGLQDYLFVFPNRRSGLFFDHYLAESLDNPVFAPEMTTIFELYSLISDETKIRVLDRIELLFNLFEVYKDISKSDESFDSFLFWGEMLLSDFNDADKYLVDTHLLFNNVTELKEIDEQFDILDEEQIKIIKTFWTNFKLDKKSDSKEVFKQTWKILFELYSSFKKKLLDKNEAYDGMFQRMIIEDLRKRQIQSTKKEESERLHRICGKKVVFVGLTALSKVDIELLSHLQKYGIAEFWWDYVDDKLNDKGSHASFFKSSTIDKFPNVVDPSALKDGLVDYKNKEFQAIEVPSGVGQAIQVAEILRQLQSQSDQNFDPIKTAVVLPDEKMLLPMLFSVPESFSPFNVTMGYSLKSTTIANFVESIAQLLANIRKEKSGITFYHKNVLPLLAIGFVAKMSDRRADMLSKEIVKNNLFRVPAEKFAENKLLKAIFKPCKNGKDCSAYLKNILNILANKAEQELEERTRKEETDQQLTLGEDFTESPETEVFSEIEREFLFAYIKLVEELDEKLKKFDIEISSAIFFSLLHKLASSETVAFKGEPLSGLQVMGVLETRSLDFDNIVILSVNEGVFPAKPVTNTFIPMNLRNAFGMPTQIHKDAVFAYHFYRLVSRAKNIYLLYDSRSDGMQTGEPSRYIKQLKYLHDANIKFKTVQYNISVEDSETISVKKDERVLNKLKECLEGGGRKLSATALKNYIHCKLSFYFQFVEGLYEENEIEEGIDDKHFGNIFHKTMQDIYDTVKGRTVMPEQIDNVLSDKLYLKKILERNFRDEMKVSELKGYLSLVSEMIYAYVVNTLNHDKLLGPFTYIASEKEDTYIYEVHDEKGELALKVNVKAILDRVDKIGDITRIVDYKTGRYKAGSRSKLQVPAISEIFSSNSKCSTEAFQTLLYSLLYNEENVSPHLYFVRSFKKDSDTDTALIYEPTKTAIRDFGRFKDDFKKALDQLLLEIFDETKVFDQTDDKRQCSYCNFKNICKRN